MRSRTATWFECKIRYEKVMEDGLQKTITENYVVDALSFSEAEERGGELFFGGGMWHFLLKMFNFAG